MLICLGPWMCFVTHPGSLCPHLYAQLQGPALTSEPGPTLVMPETDQMTPHLGLKVHFFFKNTKNIV